ncbi:MAG: hypothetical protein R6U61_08090 [Thermoplasmata archaeon]
MNWKKIISALFLSLLLLSTMSSSIAGLDTSNKNDNSEQDIFSISSQEHNIMAAPDAPSSPLPQDGNNSLPLNVTLSVFVSDPDGDDMNVSFHDASDDSYIGNVTGVTNASRVEVFWSGLIINKTYQWYAVADDGENSTQSVNWNFTTGEVDYVNITEEPGGKDLVDKDVPKNYVEWGYCSAYNNTVGFLKTVEATWQITGGNNTSLLGVAFDVSYNGIDVGNGTGLVWFNATYENITDSVLYNVSDHTIDYINITDSPNGSALQNRSVPVEFSERGYISAYNESEGYLFTIKGNWSVEGGNATLLEAATNESNVIDVGTVPTSVWFNASYGGHNYSVKYDVNPPREDKIWITDLPDGARLDNKTVPVGYTEWGNCSAYNGTVGYIGTVDANWSASGDVGTNPSVGPTPSNSSWIDVGTGAGTVSWHCSYFSNGEYHNRTLDFEVNTAELDYIDITESEGGTSITDTEVNVNETVSGYCSGYNDTAGYIGTFNATWTADGGDSKLVGASTGNTSSIFLGNESGYVWFNATYGNFSDSVMFTVREAGIDYIEIVPEEGSGTGQIQDQDIYLDNYITGFSAGYNNTIGYVKDVEVTWSVINDGTDAETTPSTGTNSTLYSGMSPGEMRWKASYSSDIEDTVNLTVLSPEIDIIQIRTESGGGGESVSDLTLKLNETETLFSAGYNRTHGYLRDIVTDWASDDTDVVQVNPVRGKSTNVSSISTGEATVFSISGGLQNSTTVSVLTEQDPSIKGAIPDIVLEEDFGVHQLDLSEHASDPQDSLSELKWYTTGVNTSILSTAGENQTGNHIISFISKRDEHGSMEITYWLVDRDENKVSQSAWVNVTPVNDAPVISECPDLYVHYDEEYSFDFSPYISDVDNEEEELSLSTDDPDHTSVRGLRVTFDYPEDMVGEEIFVKISVSDGDKTSERFIKVTVTDNYPPANVKRLPDVSIFEGEIKSNVFDLDDYIMDPDEDSLYMSYGYTHLNITIHDNHTVDMHAYSEWNGKERVTFRAQDPTGAIVEQTINVTVIAVNDPPSIKQLPPFVIHYDHPYTFDLGWYVSDSDNTVDELKISTSEPDHITVEDTKMTMVYPAEYGSLTIPYTISLTVYVSDGIDSTFGVTSITVDDNYPPELIMPLHDVTFYEDEKMTNAFDLDDHFIDVDSETIFYTSGNENITVSIHGNHSVDFFAPPDWNGHELITIRGTDPKGALMEDSLLVTVIPVNDPPVIEGIPKQEGEVGKSWILDVEPYLSDIDNEIHELTISSNSSHVEIVQHKVLFTFDEEGEYIIWVNVSDGELSDSTRLEVEIKREETGGFGLIEWGLVALVPIFLIGAAYYLTQRDKYTIEDVFLIHRSGVLIKHTTRTLKAERDEDILAGMFTAVENFVEDAFSQEREKGLKRMDYGDKKVLVHQGKYITLAVFFSGDEPKWAYESIKNFAVDIEKRYDEELKKWDGDLENLPGIEEMMEKFVKFEGKYHEDTF